MSVKKQYFKTKPLCKVTFRLSKEMAKSAETAHVVGEFNDWDVGATPMKKLKNGGFTAIIDLKPGSEYQFRYLLDTTIWENDPGADKQVPSPYRGVKNSVVIV